ncbi:hypothetical protein V4F39_10715 [Aquincola sp. MAHUQ-54]|uniref:Uncharacterized protein n=1 Tax=Aquincola agrisoli TaxID=3119538 RepID=A0AAW9QIF7_9BURK
MPSRVIAFLLSLVLLWSGIGTQELPTLSPPASGVQAMAPAGLPGDVRKGSVEDHHLDDQPSQAQGDLPGELPDQLLAVAAHGRSVLPMPGFSRLPPAPHGAPCLEGLLRPPCPAART